MTWFLTIFGTFFWLLLFLTLAPHDYVSYCQARGLSGHTSPCGEGVCFNMKDSAPPELEEDYLLFSWLDSKWAHLVHSDKNFNFELELLTPLWQVVFGSHCSAVVRAARQLLATAHNCSITHHGGWIMSFTARLCSHLLGQAQNGVAQRVQGAWGLAMGVGPQIPMADHMGYAPRGRPAHKTKPCGA